MTRLWHAIKREQATALRRAALDARPIETPWERGYAAGQADAAAALQEDMSAVLSLAKALDGLEPPEVAPIEGAIAQLAARLAIAIAGAASIDTALVQDRAKAVAETIAADWGAPTLFLNPDDLALFDTEDFGRRVEGDASLPRGSVRAQAGAAWAADGVAEAMARVAKAAGL